MQQKRRLPLGTIGYVEFPTDLREHVRFGDRMLPLWADVVFPGGGGQPRLTMRLEVIDKVPQCRDVHVSSVDGGREVRAADLKAVHVTEVTEEVFAMLGRRVVSEDGEHITLAEEWGDRAQSEAVREIAAARKGRHVRKITPEFLDKVAEVYREHLAQNPTQAVQREFDVSKRMASLYVSRAREAGLLPPTTPGKKKA